MCRRIAPFLTRFKFLIPFSLEIIHRYFPPLSSSVTGRTGAGYLLKNPVESLLLPPPGAKEKYDKMAESLKMERRGDPGTVRIDDYLRQLKFMIDYL